ncbi:hypothetical protein AU461_23300 [Vibrio parahaemolyticus]|uniref:glycerophosphodiester phosphodiesterase n=1 Tax=Vibrio parahaemolyticus TaxID=670 RepID=UPI000789B5E9|nr:glycerophosphodiester phosphodiesterase family protein [Vibrio parahaemolyticus]KYO58446.1 hypothetical protein AU461_23300 [Vibrio parahaemolyticus]KYX47722.1 hypothetical protein AU389_01955 [Vibrio parahaemolyticus]
MNQNIEQRTEVAVQKYEHASGTVDDIANQDADVKTGAGYRKSFPKISREWDEKSQNLQNEWSNDSAVIRDDWQNERNELSTKALGVKPWEAGQSESNINQQRRWTDNHTYLPKSVPALMEPSGPNDDWIPYTADKSDTLKDVFGRKPVDIHEGVILTPDADMNYPKINAFGKVWELEDNDKQLVVKSFSETSNVLAIVLDDDSVVVGVQMKGASHDWVGKWVGKHFVSQDSEMVLSTWPKDKVTYIAHRGAVKSYPENTLPAIYASQGVDAVEFDVQLSSDRHWVLMHDETVDRTTNGSGLVRDLTLSQLKELDAGSWKGGYHKNTRIPTLIEALEVCKRLNLRPVIEVKAFSSLYEADRQALIDQCLSVLGSYEFSIACGDRNVLADFRKDNKKINLMSFIYNGDHELISNEMLTLKPILVGIWYQNISNEAITVKYTSKGLQLMTFTLVSAHEIRNALKKGVVGVLSDTLFGGK